MVPRSSAVARIDGVNSPAFQQNVPLRKFIRKILRRKCVDGCSLTLNTGVPSHPEYLQTLQALFFINVTTVYVGCPSSAFSFVRNMMTFDLPYMPAEDGSYELSINESPPLHFASRGAALFYAVKLASQRQQQGIDYAINVEGGDGKWRLFRGLSRLSA